MDRPTPLGQVEPTEIAEFWQRFLSTTGGHAHGPQPAAWPFGDTVELADELVALVLEGTKRATASSPAQYEAVSAALPRVGDYAIITDGGMRPRAVIRVTETRVGPLSSVDDQFAHDEGEGDRSREFWLDAHTAYFQRVLPMLGISFDPAMATIFQRFAVVYQED